MFLEPAVDGRLLFLLQVTRPTGFVLVKFKVWQSFLRLIEVIMLTSVSRMSPF
jgi:hypothetical protein